MTQIPFLDLDRLHTPIRHQLDEAYRRVMNSGCFILGSELEAFETEFAEYCQVKHCIGVGNGLEALRLLLCAYDIGPGDEVIVPSNTFIASWLAVSQCGATPIPVDPDLETYNLDPSVISSLITSRTRAIMPVHLYGQPADIDPIIELAKKNNLVVIEDAAQAQGARYKGRRVGSLGHASGTSFYPGKNLGAIGDGGAVMTNDNVIADKVRRLRNYGSVNKYKHEVAGYNSRLDELQAAFLREKLKVLDEWNAKRRAVADLYVELLDMSEISIPKVPEFAEPVWHLFVIRSRRRNALKEYLENKGISALIHYPVPPHRQDCYASFSNHILPNADILAAEVLSLPMSPYLSQQEVLTVAEAVNMFMTESFKDDKNLNMI